MKFCWYHFLLMVVVAGCLTWVAAHAVIDSDAVRRSLKQDRPELTALAGYREGECDVYRVKAVDPYTGAEAELLIRVNANGELVFSQYDAALLDRPVQAEWVTVANPAIRP